MHRETSYLTIMDSNNKELDSRELKYLLPHSSKNSLLSSLNFKCQKDKEYPCCDVHSLYFDTSDYQFAMEKASSDYCKSKVRLRWYVTPENAMPTKCWLEIKTKLGSTRNKTRALMPFDLSFVLNQLRKSDLNNNSINQFIRKQIQDHQPQLLRLKLRPTFTVSYQRHRFYEPFSNSRIACDSNIIAEAFQINTEFTTPRTRLDSVVLEVKGLHETLPTALRPLSQLKFKKVAFSKYYECFTKLTGYTQ